jgi:hypothetical protein
LGQNCIPRWHVSWRRHSRQRIGYWRGLLDSYFY